MEIVEQNMFTIANAAVTTTGYQNTRAFQGYSPDQAALVLILVVKLVSVKLKTVTSVSVIPAKQTQTLSH